MSLFGVNTPIYNLYLLKQHFVKYRSFTLFTSVEILWKGKVFTSENWDKFRRYFTKC